MNKTNFANVMSNVKMTINKHSPEILTGLGIAGMITSTVLAVKATPKAIELLEEYKYDNNTDKVKPLKTIKVTWKCYLPSVSLSVVSALCLIGSTSINCKRNAAIATAYKLLETTHHEFKNKVIETIGEKKVKEIKDEVAKDRVEKNPVNKNTVIITNNGEQLCFDASSGRYFKSSINKIKEAVNDLNYVLIANNYISLNEFYEAIGLEPISTGSELGWSIFNNGQIKIEYSAVLTPDGEPCLSIEFENLPVYNYSTLY